VGCWSLRPGFQPPLVRGDYSVQIADRITGFVGSIHFVFLHVVWFAAWIALGVEAYPYGLLTVIVSLEAIYFSTFVMISQNRADAKRQIVADLQWQTVGSHTSRSRAFPGRSELPIDSLTATNHEVDREAAPPERASSRRLADDTAAERSPGPDAPHSADRAVGCPDLPFRDP
jgi:hypothetical protein